MRAALNRHIPFEAIVRWWYVLGIGSLLGLVFSQVTNSAPFLPLPDRKVFFIVEGPPSHIEHVMLAVDQGWKDDILFTVVGFLLACGVIWLLEEIRTYLQDDHQS